MDRVFSGATYVCVVCHACNVYVNRLHKIEGVQCWGLDGGFLGGQRYVYTCVEQVKRFAEQGGRVGVLWSFVWVNVIHVCSAPCVSCTRNAALSGQGGKLGFYGRSFGSKVISFGVIRFRSRQKRSRTNFRHIKDMTKPGDIKASGSWIGGREGVHLKD